MSTSIMFNGQPTTAAPATLAELIQAQGVVDGRGVAVAVNGVVVPRAQWAGRQLQDGDAVEVIRIMVGG